MWKRSGIVLEKLGSSWKAVLNALSNDRWVLLCLRSWLEEFWRSGRSGDGQVFLQDIPLRKVGCSPSRGRHTWNAQTRWDGSLHQLLPSLSKLNYWSSPGDRVIGQLPVICIVGEKGIFSGSVTTRQICDITVMRCHGGLSLKAQYIEFLLSFCKQVFFFCG